MRAVRALPALAAFGALVVPATASAHVMQVAYNLPVPLWMYAYGATAALLASFVVVGYFVKAGAGAAPVGSHDAGGRIADLLGAPALWSGLRVLSAVLLLLTIAAGLFGTSQPASNFNITFFWVVFGLGVTYLTALVGDFYAVVNPFHALCDALGRVLPAGFFRPRIAYPPRLAYWPALALYMGLIWLELFGHAGPRQLSVVLLSYTVLSVVLAALFGIPTWLRYLELFAVFLRLVGKIAPVEIRAPQQPADPVRFRWRAPFAGLLAERPHDLSLVVFVIFMLSSTAYDGVHETVPWVTLFWKHLFPWIQTVGTAGTPRPYVAVVKTFYWWQWLMMLLSPFVYLLVYVGFMALTKTVTRGAESIGELVRAFAFTLIPIAFVYHLTHYFTLLLGQGPAIVGLASDPFGRGWNLFGTRGWGGEGVLLEAGVIWHAQVWMILIGHVVSVYLAHVEALRLFKSPRRAIWSQLPMLALMVALTTVGLWILSMPIAAGQVLQPPTASG